MNLNFQIVYFYIENSKMAIKIISLFFIQFLAVFSCESQFYYKDIISNRQTMDQNRLMKERKVRSVKINSFEPNGEPSPGFFCEKKISRDYRKIETYSRSYVSDKSILTCLYDAKGNLLNSSDSSESTVSNSIYEYDANGNLIRISSSSYSSDDDFVTALTEIHEYSYNSQGKPVKMLKIRNQKDTAIVDFIIDEAGNVTDELDHGRNGIHYYYYYDAKNRLSDIVKFNFAKNKLLPDFTFDYNYSGQVIQMISVEEGVSSDYYTWKYQYDEGLRSVEKCFSKEGNLLGYFEYEYN